MIPIPEAGFLRSISGIEEARLVPGIEGVETTTPANNLLTPMPEGDGYGFIFAGGTAPKEVEEALRAAHHALRFTIEPLLPLVQAG